MYPLPEEELKKSDVTLWRMMEKVLADQRGWNVETFLEEIVIKSKSETDLVQDVKQTLRKLKRSKHQDWSDHVLVQSEGMKKGKNLDTCFLCKPIAEKNENMLHPNRKKCASTIHTTRSLRTVFRKHKVKVVTDGPMEETLKLARREGQMGKWAIEIRTYDISYIQRKEAEGPLVKNFFGQGEQVEETPDANKGGIFDLNKGFSENSTLTTRALRLYLGKETIKEGSGIGIILTSPKEKRYSYAIRLKFKASNHAMDCKALLAGLAASTNQGMKDLHVFIDSLTLVTYVEGNHTPATEQERRYKEKIMNATVPFYRFRIAHLLKILNLKVEVLTGLATIKLEFLNQKVSVGIKTRPLVEETSNSKKGKATSKALGAKPNCNHEASGSN
nr:hypothetical protein [Tanacetum cinerariifolium]